MPTPYELNLPCKNPNCHSHGRPHPNCKCYGFAKGGRVDGFEHFCSKERMHQKECEYYSEGGSVAPDWNSLSVEPPKESPPGWNSLSTEAPTAPDWNELSQEPPGKESKYSSLGQQVKTGLEGAAQGIAGPLATLAETELLGVDPKDIKGRAEENPWIHGGAEAATLVGGLLTGTGEAGLIAKVAGGASEMANLGKIGTLALKSAIEGASFAGSDEITKAILNQPGSDPETPASAALLHVGAAGLMGALTGGIFGLGEGMIGKGIEKLENQKMVDKTVDWLAKIGESKDPLGDLGVANKITQTVAATAAIKSGTGPLGYEVVRQVISKPVSQIVGKGNPYVTDAAIKAILTNEVSGLPNAVHYGTQILRGAQKATSGINSLFTPGTSQIAAPASDSAKSFLKSFIEGGQVDQQMQNSMSSQPDGFATGGQVSSPNNSFSMIFPEQNTILNAAKGRISNYLNSIRPLENQPKLPFDRAPSQIEKKRSYDKAIDFAVNPMSILNHVNKGDLTPEHMQHFTALYPDVHKYLSQEMTKRITKAQLKDEKPTYGKRQAMSLFLGADLDSTFTPQSIAAIQGLYAVKAMQQQQQAPQKAKKGTAPLSKASNSYLTDGQARIQRSQNSKA